MEYQALEENTGMVSEDISINYVINKRSDISRGITADELLHRLRPRIESMFK